jgi:hypothetical protein
MGVLFAKQSAVAVMFARSPKETFEGVVAGSASIPQEDQLFDLNKDMAVDAKAIGAIAAVANRLREVTAPE